MNFTWNLIGLCFGTKTILLRMIGPIRSRIQSATLAVFTPLLLTSLAATAATLEQDEPAEMEQAPQQSEGPASDTVVPEYRADELIRNFTAPDITGSINDNSGIPSVMDESLPDQEPLFGD